MVEDRDLREKIEQIYRTDSRRAFATLIRLIGDFDLAELCLDEAFTAALEQWSKDGIPDNPRAWLVSTARFKAIDILRRRKRFDQSAPEIADKLEQVTARPEDLDEARFRDDHLRLIFTCCHPALPPNARIALTLREVCGLKTEEIAAAFLTTAPTIAQRILRGKAKIREAGIPYAVPGWADLPQRLDSVLSVAYLIFNEGYSASSGESVTRTDLSAEAIRLARVLLELMPDAEVMGLLALMLLHDSRRLSRTTPQGDIILLEDQDRSLWNRARIAEGRALVERALATNDFGAYTIQAAISAVHAESVSAGATDWGRIVALYDLLLTAEPSPIVELNRAVAVAMRDGPEAGLPLVDGILARGELAEYHLIHAARADLCRRLGRREEARASYERALALARQDPERRFLLKRMEEIG